MAQTHTLQKVFRAGVVLGVHLSRAYQAETHTPNDAAGTAVCSSANAVNVSQATSIDGHPLASVSGLFADDPLWVEYLQAIKEIGNELAE